MYKRERHRLEAYLDADLCQVLLGKLAIKPPGAAVTDPKLDFLLNAVGITGQTHFLFGAGQIKDVSALQLAGRSRECPEESAGPSGEACGYALGSSPRGPKHRPRLAERAHS
jgi:hypothetical protein